MKRTLNLEMDPFGRTTIESQAERHAVKLGDLLRQAVHYYLSDEDSGRVGWRYPRFRRGAEGGGEEFDVVVDVDEVTWRRFTVAAEAQSVPLERLLEHAALYFVADVNSGRVTARILETDD